MTNRFKNTKQHYQADIGITLRSTTMQRETALLHQIAHMILFHIVYVFKLAVATSLKRHNKGFSKVHDKLCTSI